MDILKIQINTEDGQIDVASGALLNIVTETESNPPECNKMIK